MGEQIRGRILNRSELLAFASEINQRYIQSVVDRFQKIYPIEHEDPKILDAGIEIETTLVDAHNNPAPIFEELEKVLGKGVITGEKVNFQAEVKTNPKKLFGLHDSLDEVICGIKDILNPLHYAAQEFGATALLMGGYPLYNEEATKFLFKSPRFDAFGEMLSPLAQDAIIPFVDGSAQTYRNNIWAGFATNTQTTIKVPHSATQLYYNAAYVLGPLLFAVSASSPLVEGKLTMYDSARIHLNPPATYGFTQEDFERGRPNRWRALEPMIENTENPQWFNQEMYEALIKIRVPSPIARYFGTIAADGHIVITEEDVAGQEKDFPEVNSWPFVKLKYKDVMDAKGIGIELRMNEMPRNAEEMAAFNLTQMAMLQGIVEEMQRDSLQPLASQYVERNMTESSLHNSHSYKKCIWPYRNGTPVAIKSFPDLFEYLGKLSVDVLKRYGHTETDIKEIINPVLTKAGVLYQGKGYFKNIQPEPTPAQLMRKIAYTEQPNMEKGEKILPATLHAVLEPFTYKP